jgi:hypothetical protein
MTSDGAGFLYLLSDCSLNAFVGFDQRRRIQPTAGLLVDDMRGAI